MAKEDSFVELVSWIRSNGGYVHPDLEIFSTSTGYRGIRVTELCTDGIKQGEMLARIPSHCILQSIKCAEGDIIHECNASNWLKCLGALLRVCYDVKGKHSGAVSAKTFRKYDDMSFFEPYIRSLPDQFDTIASWNDDSLKSLKGTSLFETIIESRSNSEADENNISLSAGIMQSLRERFLSSNIQSYLANVLELNDDIFTVRFEEFLWATNCVTTRGFHLTPTHKDPEDNFISLSKTNPNKRKFETIKCHDNGGPYLIPFVDLLNHCSIDDIRKGTTLRCDHANSAFFIEAERHISPLQEILHSYGQLNSLQLLQTYGFVDLHRSELLLKKYSANYVDKSYSIKVNCRLDEWDLTPAIVNREIIVSTCREVAMSSDTLKKRIEIEKCVSSIEVWDPSECWDDKIQFVSDFIPEFINISYDMKIINCELLTLCCILFLPKEAFDDYVESPALLDESILDDAFLRHLVSMSICKVLQAKCMEYVNDSALQDSKILIDHINDARFNKKNIFGMIVAFEEKLCIESAFSRISSINGIDQ